VAQQPFQQEFQIGLAMAGAISAGAYSAGVLDFVIQALDEWEKAKNDPATADDVPNHRAAIKVVTGASAGAITGALGVVGLAQGLTPKPYVTASKQQVNCVLPCLYESWVIKPSLVSATGGSDFLLDDDLNDKDVLSLLDSRLLDQIASSALKFGAAKAQQFPYVSKRLHVYMTLTNLRGVPYKVKFDGGDFVMMCHGDRAHYTITDIGTWTTTSPFADVDPGRTLSASALWGSDGPSNGWREFTDIAVASGAFPAGLAPRPIDATLPEYDKRSWPMEPWPVDRSFGPDWPQPWGGDGTRGFSFLSIDGGVVNNDPFDYAHYALMEEPPKRNPSTGEQADRAVIMIDPFPEPPPFPADNQPEQTLVAVLSRFVPVLINQARFKPSELILAASETFYSRYLVAPSRPKPKPLEGDEQYAIACGLLGGFGGFLSRAFREHDFILGQRNCQKFLRAHFALPNNSEIIQQWPQAARDNPDFAAPVRPGETPHYCIIPLIGKAKVEVASPPWPQLSQDEFDAVQVRIAQRLDKVAQKLIAAQATGGLMGVLLSRVYSWQRKSILEFIKLTMLADLVRRNQMQGWDLPATWKQAPSVNLDGDKVRAVLAALLDPSYDLRNAGGIAAATRLDIATVNAVLAACQAETGAPYEVWQSPRKDRSGGQLFALASRKSGWFASVPGVRAWSDWVSPPQVDKPGL
jgi:patatin-like phospholipase